MKIEDIKKMKVGEWFIMDRSFYYITGIFEDGFIYSSNQFLSTTHLYIGFQDKYKLIHDSMNYIGKTKYSFWYWIMPSWIAEMLCPYVKPNINFSS